MPGGESVYYAFGAILAVASTALMAAAIASPDWYEIHSGSIHQRVGYFEFCNTTGGPIPYEDCVSAPFDVAFCGHESGPMKARQGAGAALGLIGAALMLVVSLLMFVGWWFRNFMRCVIITAIVFTAVALAGYLVAIIIICLFFEKWYYCETDFCSYASANLGATDCSFFHGYSFVYGIIAAILAALVICLLIGLFIHTISLHNREVEEESVKSEERKRLNNSRDRGEDPSAQNESRSSSGLTGSKSTASNPRSKSTKNKEKDEGLDNSTSAASAKYNRSVSAQSNHAPDFSTSPQSAARPNQSRISKANESTSTRYEADREQRDTTNRNVSTTSTNRRLQLEDAGQRGDYDFNNAPPLPRSRSKQLEEGSPTRKNRLPPTATYDRDDDEEMEDTAFAPNRTKSRSGSGGRNRSQGRGDDENDYAQDSVMLSNLTRQSSNNRHDQNDTQFTVPNTDNSDGKLGFWPTDWVFHAQSQLYWSASQQLYLDPKTEHYFDPHSNKWFDSKRDVWYTKE